MNILILIICLFKSTIIASGVNIDSLIVREDLDDKGKRYLPTSKIPFDGTVYKKYPTGETEFQGNIVLGLQEGMWTWSYITGEKKSEVSFVNNFRHGEYRLYFESGVLQELGSFLKGKKEGLWIKYYESQKKK